MNLRHYRPLTATPFTRSAAYAETPPGPALTPYVRCFWGTPGPHPTPDAAMPSLVIPDTCMDIILNAEKDQVTATFCAMDERPSIAAAAASSARITFAVRFAPWAAVLFMAPTLKGTANGRFDAENFFPGLKRELAPVLLRSMTLRERAKAAEPILLRRLNVDRLDPACFSAVDTILRHRGTLPIADLCAREVLSPRQLERLFSANIGVSPKTFSALIRYQLLWRDLCCGATDMLDLVEKYGYYDQAHLLDDFRLRHGINPAQALHLARL